LDNVLNLSLANQRLQFSRRNAYVTVTATSPVCESKVIMPFYGSFSLRTNGQIVDSKKIIVNYGKRFQDLEVPQTVKGEAKFSGMLISLHGIYRFI
jgi:hypothetical protein